MRNIMATDKRAIIQRLENKTRPALQSPPAEHSLPLDIAVALFIAGVCLAFVFGCNAVLPIGW